MSNSNNNKKIIVYTSGTWDLLHVGHLNILKRSKALGDKLIVGVSTDELVASYKNSYPIISYEDRVEIIKSIKFVDQVVKQEKLLEIKQLIELKVDIVTIGDDWKDRYLEGLEWAEKQPNVKLVYLHYTKRLSTTLIKEKIKNEWFKK